MNTGYLVLETGEIFEGEWIGSTKEMYGEVVFNTSMTGYQEMMTDPSYAGQILSFCYPLIGNYGLNEQDHESKHIAVSGVILNELCEEPSHFQSSHSFEDQLKEENIPGLKNVDTRALVAAIRKHQTVKGKLVHSKEESHDHLKVLEDPHIPLVDHVSVKEFQTFQKHGPHVVLVDYGYKKSILDALLDKQCRVTIVPYNTPLDKIDELEPDGILLSNGPGDPMKLTSSFSTIRALTEKYPTLGICLGHQLIALAYGAKTVKMPFGHRGGNHPVKDLLSGKVTMTSQNHGYVVVEESVDESIFQIQFRNVNDKSLEGIKHKYLPIQSVQFHPEGHPGPSDTTYIFQQFIDQVVSAGGEKLCGSVTL
ncbi:carbamoyl phosphate synthase small subunit [Salipaludibacillus keqinensis]|uniref:Carbamoyl phosphate synthase small chain n=1 Tax=Salipaludibacillus keqinensis TaxID=2045207 RepID=A0A323TZW2_9BACI|nr:carbamoyl phosphate synthase small subunit [Salipaludibacillus keqinensis]PYZ95135.1 carbamoyl phosphate synthase small subunit [Salipaludibacillus keqinensis]